MVSLSKEYNQIVNLVKFNVNFSKFVDSCDLVKQSPDYILEKYQHWIGFTPTVEYKMYTPDDMVVFFNKYFKIWKLDTESYHKLKNILMYLYSTQNMNLIKMCDKFEEYIGPMSMISDIPDKKGLHHLTERFVGEVLGKNKDNVKVVLRDMKIANVIV
jgi:ribosomal protein L30E